MHSISARENAPHANSSSLPALRLAGFLLTAGLALTASSLDSRASSHEAFNNAQFDDSTLPVGYSELTSKLQVLLDRAHFSPGVIDGYEGGNTVLAIRSLETANGLKVDGMLDASVWDILVRNSDAENPVFTRYKISQDDVSNITPDLPEDYSELAKLDWLGHESVPQKLAEKFHMDVDFLRKINPGSDWSAGSEVSVANPGEKAGGDVEHIIVDKSREQIVAKDGDGNTIATYPATIGSNQTPSPKGTHEVVAIATEPTYSYKPDENFTQGDNTEPLSLPPGPNNPVGLVWIDLSKPTYGLHGSGDPASIGKTASHGCVRMTNWDALELAGMVSEGATVEFSE